MKGHLDSDLGEIVISPEVIAFEATDGTRARLRFVCEDGRYVPEVALMEG